MKNGSFPLCPKWIRHAGPFAVTALLLTASGCATFKQTFSRPPGALDSDPRATALVAVDCHLLTQLGWTGRGDMLVHGASIRGEDASTQLFEPMLTVKFGDVCILFQGLPPGGYRVSEIVTVSMDYNANTKGTAPQLHGFNVSSAEDLAFKAGPGRLVYVGRFHPYVRGHHVVCEWIKSPKLELEVWRAIRSKYSPSRWDAALDDRIAALTDTSGTDPRGRRSR